MNKKESKTNEPNVKEVNIIVPPDGGYAWVIVIASFASNFAVDGIAFSFSIAILPDLSEKLGMQPSKVAIISSVQLGSYYLFGPVACALINHFGFRVVGICGCIVSFTGIFIASHIESFAAVLVLYGIIAGIGFGMIYTSAIISVGYYFEKYRALSTGIAVCGSSIGGLCLSPLFANFVKKDGWQNTMRMQSYFMFICFFSSLAYRPLKPTQRVPLTHDIINEIDQLTTPSRVEFTELYKTNSMVSIDLDDPSEESRHFPQIAIISSRFLPISQMKRNKKRKVCSCSCLRNLCLTSKAESYGNVISTGPLDRKDIFYSASVVQLPEYRNTKPTESILNGNTMLSYHLSMILDSKMMQSQSTHLPPSQIPIVTVQKKTSHCFGISHMIHNALINLFDVSLLKSSVFCLLASVCFCYSVAWMTPYIFMPKRAELNEIPESYINWFISCISIGNTVGRAVAGVLATIFPRINPCYMVGFASMSAGAVTIISAFLLTKDSYFQLSYCVIFGFFIAFLTALRPIVTVRLLGLDKLTNAFGLSAVVIGIGVLAGTPIASTIYDKTGSYEVAFMLSGVLFILSGLLIILAFFVYSRQERKE